MKGRTIARRLAKAPELVPLPEIPDSIAPQSHEAQIFLTEHEPARLASIAQAIGKVLDRTFVTSLEAHKDRSVQEPWRALASDIIARVKNGRRAAQPTPQYGRAVAFNKLYGRLAPERCISVARQIDGGTESAVTSSLTFLRNLPCIVQTLRPGTAEADYATIARASVALPQPMALLCLNGLSAARDALAVDRPVKHTGWDTDTILDPAQYRLAGSAAAGIYLRHESFADLSVPEGYQLAEGMAPLTEATKVKDIPCFLEEKFGCPIMYLDNVLNQFWQWQVDAVEARQLWTV
jgi:hypothetical protein